VRRLGQHFLNDPTILARIVDALEPVAGERVLEIGPGQGSLTRALLARGLTVLAIEKDRALAERLTHQGINVVLGDALKVDWPRVAKVVGNIPYYITSPLLEKALTTPLPERVVFLVQLEVADRLAAKPGSKIYGALSVGVQAICRVEKLFTVAPGAFKPPPQVRSAVVRLTPLAAPLIMPEEVAPFRRFVTGCFSKRRKQLKNAVPGMGDADFQALGLDPQMRPERLSPEMFVRLWRVLAMRAAPGVRG
jgi:16S rRNA (adenine1518-N6/adenine1519-N6)-dimethyltransferase